MSTQLTILEGGRGVEILAGGIVRGDELIEAIKANYTERNLPLLRYQIIDKSCCTQLNLTADDIDTIASLDKAASLANPKLVRAVIDSIKLQCNPTDLWQAHRKDFWIRTESFQDRESATRWILENTDHT